MTNTNDDTNDLRLINIDLRLISTIDLRLIYTIDLRLIRTIGQLHGIVTLE